MADEHDVAPLDRGYPPRPEDEVARKVIGCIIKVHRTLGPGFLEQIYRRALRFELWRQGLRVESEKEVLIFYEGHMVGRHRIDLLVEGKLILELKAVTTLHTAHYAQVRSYLQATRLHLAILVNFSTPRADFRRVSR